MYASSLFTANITSPRPRHDIIMQFPRHYNQEIHNSQFASTGDRRNYEADSGATFCESHVSLLRSRESADVPCRESAGIS